MGNIDWLEIAELPEALNGCANPPAPPRRGPVSERFPLALFPICGRQMAASDTHKVPEDGALRGAGSGVPKGWFYFRSSCILNLSHLCGWEGTQRY